MKIVTTIILLLMAFLAYGQNDSMLKLTVTKENVVASAIDGSWKPKDKERQLNLEFTNDVGVLKILSKKYYKAFSL